MERIIIGKITSPHGIKGEVKVLPLTDYPDRFYRTKSVWVDSKKGYLTVESIRKQMEMFLIKFQGVDVRSDAEKLNNSFLTIDHDQAIDLPPGHFFRFQIIGLNVYDVQGTYLGELTEIMETGANDVYVVQRADKKELLIPALKAVVREIDITNKRMTVDLPAGLEEC